MTKAFFHKITVWHSHRDKGPLIVMRWDNLPHAVAVKWRWYFNYRAALLQVQHPKAIIEHTWGAEEPSGRTQEHILRMAVSNAQGQLTKHLNRVDRAKREWEKDRTEKMATIGIDMFDTSTFESLPGYDKVIEKTNRKRFELKAAQRALEVWEANKGLGDGRSSDLAKPTLAMSRRAPCT